MVLRRCTKTGCPDSAVATLTYVYADQTAVLGPLAPEHIPGSYDLCREHCEQLSAPRGWETIRLEGAGGPAPSEGADDLLALADAVREVGLRPDEVEQALHPARTDEKVVTPGARRHLRVVADEERTD